VSLGTVLALIVLIGVLLSFVIALPGWVVMAFIGLLAVAFLTGGVVIFPRA
jgi:hypothetical protein